MNTMAIAKEEILAAENELLAAQRTGDADRLNELLHCDLLALGPDGQILDRETDLEAYRAGGVKIEEADAEIEEVRLLGDTAVCVVSLRARGTVMGAPLAGHFRYLRIWKRCQGKLKVVAAAFRQLT